MDGFTYRPCVGIMLLNSQGLVFVGRRKSRRSPDVMPPSMSGKCRRAA